MYFVPSQVHHDNLATDKLRIKQSYSKLSILTFCLEKNIWKLYKTEI